MSSFTIREQAVTFGDEIDLHLVDDKADCFARARLLFRWLNPTPTAEDLRGLPRTTASTLFQQVAVVVRRGIEFERETERKTH